MATKQDVLAELDRRQTKDEGMSALGAIAQGAGQGASFGFGEEITSGLGAGVAGTALNLTNLLGMTDVERPYGQSYDQLLERQRENIHTASEDRPASYLLGNVAGGLATGGLGATTKTGRAVGEVLAKGALPAAATRLGRAGNLASRIGTGAGIGGASTAAFEYGTAEGGADKRTDAALESSPVGAALGAAFPALGAVVNSFRKGAKTAAVGTKARNAEALDETLANIKQHASDAYAEMRDAGAVLGDRATKDVGRALQGALKKNKIRNKRLHGKTLSVVDDIAADIEGGKIGLEELDQHRTTLGQIIANKVEQTESFAASKIKNALDGALNDLTEDSFTVGSKTALESLKKGRSLYARTKKFQTVAEIVKKADGDANYLKRELKKLLDNKKKTIGFTQDEIAALKEASRLSGGEGAAKLIGKFGFDLGNSRIGSGAAGGVAGILTAGAYGTPAGLAVPVIGTAGRQVQKSLGRGKAERLLRTIEGRADDIAEPLSGDILLPAATGAQAPTALPRDNNGAPQDRAPALPAPGVSRDDILMELQRRGSIGPQSNFTQQNEGLRLSAYQDTPKNRAVGYGFNLDDPSSKRVWKRAGVDVPIEDVRNGRTSITPQQAEALYKVRMSEAVRDAQSFYGKGFEDLSQSKQMALTDMSYQMGGKSLSGFTGLRKALRANDKNAIVESIRKSKYAGDTPKRANEILSMLMKDS